MPPSNSVPSLISTNRHARRDYKILETFEAGIALTGSEVKSIRAGKVNLNDAFARIEKGEAYLFQCDIASYDKAGAFNHEPRRTRKLLLHQAELQRLFGLNAVKGRSLPALDLHWKSGRVKVTIGVGEGKTHGDKRDTVRANEARREIDRAIKNRNRSA
jgi:SsrA-binding protein